LCRGCEGWGFVAEVLARLVIVGRGCRQQVTFFVSPKKVTKEMRPHIPALRVPESRACRTGVEELAPLLLF